MSSKVERLSGADYMVEEYLLYRGFTQTFRCLDNEKASKSKNFQEQVIVQQIFQYLINFEVESFINLWDFLSKRFFLHLDQEHVNLIDQLKTDLLKYYLINAVKANNKPKIHEFFSTYSHEILMESGDSGKQSLRNWYVLPYVEFPEKDHTFSAYYSSRWADSLRVTLTNFISVVFLSAPPPKLLLLDSWFDSEAQKELRTTLKNTTESLAGAKKTIEQYERRMNQLHNAVLDLSQMVQSATAQLELANCTEVIDKTQTSLEGSTIKNKNVYDLGKAMIKLASECAAIDPSARTPTPRASLAPASSAGGKSRGRSSMTVQQPLVPEKNVEELEGQMIIQLQRWKTATSFICFKDDA